MKRYTITFEKPSGTTCSVGFFAHNRDDAVEFVKRNYKRSFKKLISARQEKEICPTPMQCGQPATV